MQCRYKSMRYQKKCVICGKPFSPSNPRQRVCGSECSYEFNRRYKKERYEAARSPATCVVCGRRVSGVNRKFCSAKCNAKWYGSAVSGERKAMRIRQPVRKQEPPKMHYEKPVVMTAKPPAPRAALKCNPARLPARGTPRPIIQMRKNIIEYLDEREEKRL